MDTDARSLPPFSGRNGRCPKCRCDCASTKHLVQYPRLRHDLMSIRRRGESVNEEVAAPYRGYLAAFELETIPQDAPAEDRREWVPAPWWPAEWLHRCCQICGYRWDEALAVAAAPTPAPRDALIGHSGLTFRQWEDHRIAAYLRGDLATLNYPYREFEREFVADADGWMPPITAIINQVTGQPVPMDPPLRVKVDDIDRVVAEWQDRFAAEWNAEHPDRPA